jgi:hypothetical protein
MTMSEPADTRSPPFPPGVRDPDLTGSARATFSGGVALYTLAMIFAVGAAAAVGGLAGFVVGFSGGLGFALLATRMLRRSKRQRAVGALALLARDPRPPVVYFRSFAHDAVTAKGVNSTSWITEEEQLATVLSGIGPVVAIGEPGEELPDVGASRFYVPDEQWRDAVRAILPRSALAVLRIGHTKSFWWEVEQALARRAPERTVLLLPCDEALYEQFRTRFATMAPCALPTLPKWRRGRWRGSLLAVIFFDQDWQPTVTTVPSYPVPFFRRSPAFPLVPVLTMVLEPVHRQIGAPWKPPGVSARLLVVLALLVIAALCMLYDIGTLVSG